MKMRLTFIIGLACAAASCGGSTSRSVPRPEAGVGTSTTGGTGSDPSGGSVVASAGGGGATGGATSASPSSLAGTQSPDAGITSMGGTATGGKVATGGAGGGTTGGSSLAGGAGGATTPVSSATGGATGGATIGGKSTVSAAGAGGGGTMATATGGTSATSSACVAGPPLTGGTQRCNQNTSGSYDNYTWKLWSNTSSACLTTYSDGAFSVNWDFAKGGDLLAGVGLKFDATKTHQELGVFSADFAEGKTGNTLTGSTIGIYGYSLDPSVEFYIADDSFQAPTKPWNSQLLGTLPVDDGVYDIYKATASSETKTIISVYSIRQEHRSCGHISISTHFSRWKDLGVTMGKMQEVKIAVAALGGTGSVDFTKVKVEVN